MEDRQAVRQADFRENERYLICSNEVERQRCCGWGKENNCKWVIAVVRKQWRNALRHGLSSSINHDVSSGDNIQSHSQAKLARSQGASVFLGGDNRMEG